MNINGFSNTAALYSYNQLQNVGSAPVTTSDWSAIEPELSGDGFLASSELGEGSSSEGDSNPFLDNLISSWIGDDGDSAGSVDGSQQILPGNLFPPAQGKGDDKINTGYLFPPAQGAGDDKINPGYLFPPAQGTGDDKINPGNLFPPAQGTGDDKINPGYLFPPANVKGDECPANR